MGRLALDLEIREHFRQRYVRRTVDNHADCPVLFTVSQQEDYGFFEGAGDAGLGHQEHALGRLDRRPFCFHGGTGGRQ